MHDHVTQTFGLLPKQYICLYVGDSLQSPSELRLKGALQMRHVVLDVQIRQLSMVLHKATPYTQSTVGETKDNNRPSLGTVSKNHRWDS